MNAGKLLARLTLCTLTLAACGGGKDDPEEAPKPKEWTPAGDCGALAPKGPAVLDKLEEEFSLKEGMPVGNLSFLDENCNGFELTDAFESGYGLFIVAFRHDAPRLKEALKVASNIDATLKADPDHKGRIIRVLGVLTGVNSPEEARKFIADNKIGFKVAVDYDRSLSAQLKLRDVEDGIAAYIIRGDGILHYYALGYMRSDILGQFPTPELAEDFYIRLFRRQMKLPDPAPDFKGVSFNGKEIGLGDYKGRSLLLFFFNDTVAHPEWYIGPLSRIYADKDLVNLSVVGVYMKAAPEEAEKQKAFMAGHNVPFEVIPDPQLEIAHAFFLSGEAPAVVYIDGEGNMKGRNETRLREDVPNPEGLYEDVVRGYVGLPETGAIKKIQEEMAAKAGEPKGTQAPRILGKDIVTGAEVDTEKMSGKALVVLFFNPTCPHCLDALNNFLIKEHKHYQDLGVEMLGVSVTQTGTELAQSVKRINIPFPVLEDPEWEIRNRWGMDVNQPIPVTYFVDKEGHVVVTSNAFENEYHTRLYRLYSDLVAGVAGSNKPETYLMEGYSGPEFCGACHMKEASQYLTTGHAVAMRTLKLAEKKPGADHPPAEDGECVSCHVTGFEEKHGFDFDNPEATPYLVNVGCESCHTAGGPHAGSEPAPKSAGEYVVRCISCHNKTHSLNFKYDEFVPYVNHTKPGHVDPNDRKLFEGQYVGNATCIECHKPEADHWATTAHAKAWDSLKPAEQTGKCSVCHVTGYGAPGGFSLEAPDPAMTGVGCESCHGPGKAHSQSKLKDDILGMGAECEFCVIEKVCASCHDSKNDPGFSLHADLARIKHHPENPAGPEGR